jgi:type 2 lantibiotic biosynthesis protein LanM
MYSSLLSQAMDGNTIQESMPSSVLSDTIRKRWLETLGSLEPEKLDRRLLWDHLNPTKLNSLLRNVEDGYSDLASEWSVDIDGIPWAIALDNICKAIQAHKNQHLSEPEGDTTGFEVAQLPFRDLWQPAVEWAVVELRRRLDPLIGVGIHDNVFNHLGYSLLARFCSVAEYVLWDLFNVERAPSELLLAYRGTKADGSSSPVRDRYQQFIQRHRGDGLALLLREFPVLGYLLGNVLVFWLDSNEEMLLRVHQDRKFLLDIFNIPADASLDSIRQGLSDHHCGGRTVAILTFKLNSNTWKVVYKPRDMGIDEAYQQVLVDLNKNSGLSPLKTLKILKRQNYGYMEFVEHRLCQDQQELKRFYYNAGRLCAILYALGCIDCHHENLIADGDQLVLIDTETLFEPTVVDHVANASQSKPSKPPSDLHKRFGDSILRSGLVPYWWFFGVEKYALDMSALGIASPVHEHEFVSGWVGLNTDGMLRTRVKKAAFLPTSLPVGIGKANPLQQHIEDLVRGFKEQSYNLIQRRSDWLRPGGALDRFVGLPRRIVLRATQVYFSIQIQQLQAQALRSTLSQGMKLEQLARFFLLAETRPKHWPIFAAEVRQMEQLDIPYFIHQIDNSQLPLPDGIGVIDDFMKTNGLQSSRQRLADLDEDAIAFQVHLIEGAIQSQVLRVHCHLPYEIRTQSGVNSLALSASDRLREALNIGRKLVDLAFQNDHKQPEWLGFDLAADGDKFLFRPLEMSLYSGSIGIAVFFACLNQSQTQASGVPRVEGLRKMVQDVLRSLTELTVRTEDGKLLRWWRDQPMGLAGSGGQLLALMAMDRIGVAPDGFATGCELACQLLEGLRETYIVNASRLDLLSGVAGLIGPLLLLNTAKSVQLAKLAGDRLVETQGEVGGWGDSNSKSAPFLQGFFHSTAGMVAALAQLYQHTEKLHYRDAALKALAYERKQFTVRMENSAQTHFDGTNNANGVMDNLYHKAAEIGFSRLCLMNTDLWDSTAEQEVRMAMETIGRIALPVDHICCGSFGQVAILRLAHQRLDNEMWRVMSDRIESSSLDENLKRAGKFRLLGTPEANQMQPGFMTGLSGIGMILLDDENSLRMIRTLLSAGLLME